MKKGQQVKAETKKCDNGCRGHKTRTFHDNLNVKHCLRVQKSATLEKDVSICGNLNVKGNVTSNQIDTPTLNATTLNSTTVNATNIVTTDLKTTNAEISNLTVESINGTPFDCGETFVNTNSDITRVVDNVKPENPGIFNQTVWDNLWDITQLQMNALSDRLQCGRLQERFIQEKFNCVVCPPDQLVDCHPTCPGGSGGDICACPDEVGDCPRVRSLSFLSRCLSGAKKGCFASNLTAGTNFSVGNQVNTSICESTMFVFYYRNFIHYPTRFNNCIQSRCY